ncbi:MAG: hypothetical protein CSA33_02190 [Desulfobulbus propionicus]|nr:MAG: hypothetical protein CSA33_02190 [Desulfobulbus propionicus]
MIPKASVIIPCFNVGKTIGRTIQAFRSQAIPAKEYEIILIDDCSTDNTAAEISRQASGPPFLFLQNTQNSGPAYTRNRGLDLATGTIVIFSDGDTVPCAHYLAEHLAAHERHPENHSAIVGAAAMPEDMHITPLMYLGNVVQSMNSAVYRPDAPYNWLHFSTLNVSLKRDFIGSMRFNDRSFTRHSLTESELAGFEDTEFAQRLAKKGMRLLHAPAIRAFHYHFRTPENYMNKVREYGEHFAHWITLCDPEEAQELQKRLNFLLDRENLLSRANIRECIRRVFVNDLSVPCIRGAARFFETSNENISLFLYNKLYKYLFLKGYRQKMKSLKKEELP